MATELKAAMRKLIAGKGLRSLGYAEGWLR